MFKNPLMLLCAVVYICLQIVVFLTDSLLVRSMCVSFYHWRMNLGRWNNHIRMDQKKEGRQKVLKGTFNINLIYLQ